MPFIWLENTAIYELIFCETRIQTFYVGICSSVSTLKLTSKNLLCVWPFDICKPCLVLCEIHCDMRSQDTLHSLTNSQTLASTNTYTGNATLVSSLKKMEMFQCIMYNQRLQSCKIWVTVFEWFIFTNLSARSNGRLP